MSNSPFGQDVDFVMADSLFSAWKLLDEKSLDSFLLGCQRIHLQEGMPGSRAHQLGILTMLRINRPLQLTMNATGARHGEHDGYLARWVNHRC